MIALSAGLLVLRLTLSGAYTSYVRVGMRPFLLAAAVLLLVAGVTGLAHLVRTATATATATDDHDHDHVDPHGDDVDHDVGHGHDHGRLPAAAALLLLPLLLVVLVSPPPLGSFTAGRIGGTPLTTTERDRTPLGGDPAVALPLTVSEVVRRAGAGTSLAGRSLVLTGFVAGDPAAPLLTRFTVKCCAADATPVHVILALPGGPVPRTDSWIAVTGTWQSSTGDAAAAPRLAVTSWTGVEQPEDPYE